MAILFSIDDEKELYSLWIALLEAKFHPEPEMPEVQGSSFVARLIEKVINSLIAYEESQYNAGNAERYREHLKRGERIVNVLPVVRKHIQSVRDEMWQNWTKEQKESFVKDLLSPFEISETLFRELINNKGKN
jgi:hypothetical protein